MMETLERVSRVPGLLGPADEAMAEPRAVEMCFGSSPPRLAVPPQFIKSLATFLITGAFLESLEKAAIR